MNLEDLRLYCLSKKGVTEEFPFDNETLVFKVSGKIFLLTGINGENSQFNVKCDSQLAIELREKYNFVIPGYHMSKKHWNTVFYNGKSDKLLKEFIDHSYELVIKGLPKALRENLI